MQEHPTPTAVTDPDGAARETSPDGQATGLAEVAPLDYTQLRLLAECAVGMKKNDHVDFFFAEPGVPGRRSRLKVQSNDRTLTNMDVLVPASNPETKFPGNRVTVSVSGGEVSAVESQPLMGIADAMFWSDAAVQKFVVPYLASCTGSGAVQALQLLQQAWNSYPANVAVYALAHVAAFGPGVEISLAKAFQVGFVETADMGGDPPLQWMPLDDFTTKYRPAQGVGDSPKEPVPYHRGKSHLAPQHPDYQTLRAMAEYAASIRGPARYFLLRQDQDRPERRGFVGPFKFLPRVGFGDIVVPVRTPAVPEGRGEPGAVWFQAPEGSATNLAEMNPRMDLPQHDAVFWSTGAIEQFLFPYYASKGGFASLRDLARMFYVWTGHMPPAWNPDGPTQTSFAVQTEEEPGDLPHGDEVYGLVHLYTSEWVEETESGAGTGGDGTDDTEDAGAMRVKQRLELAREIAVVSPDRDKVGHLQVTPLHRFSGWHHLP